MSVSPYKFDCPECKVPIAPYNVNVLDDIVKCGQCGQVYKASDLMDDRERKAKRMDKDSIPKGCRIEIHEMEDGVVEFQLPKLKNSYYPYMFMPFAVVFTGALVYMTIMMTLDLGFAVLVMFPFWAFAISLWVAILNSFYVVEKLRLGPEGVSITTEMFTKVKQTLYRMDEIKDVRLKSYTPMPDITQPFRFIRMGRLENSWQTYTDPVIISGKGNFYFFQRANDAEKEWLVEYLQALLEKYQA